MNAPEPRIAVVEEEFLIALDAEFLIGQTLHGRVHTVRPDQFARWTDSDLSAIDLCLIDVPMQAEQAAATARRLVRLGTPFIFTTVSEEYRHGVEGFNGTPVLMKPYDGEILLAVVTTMLRSEENPQN